MAAILVCLAFRLGYGHASYRERKTLRLDTQKLSSCSSTLGAILLTFVLQVVQHTMSLLGTLTELQPELSSVMLSSPGLGPALEFSLLHTPEKLVRKEVSIGVLRMAISLRKKSKVRQRQTGCVSFRSHANGSHDAIHVFC